MSALRSLIAVSALCFFASASLAPAFAQTARGGTHDDSSGNAIQLLPAILKAIQDQKKREAERRKAAERAREEQQQQDQQNDQAAAVQTAPPVIQRPIPKPVHVLRPKPKPHRSPPVTKPLLTPTPQPKPVIAPPVVAPPPPAEHFQPVATTPQLAAPLTAPERDGLLIFIVVAAAGAIGAAAYVFRGAFGFAPLPPTARAVADLGNASAPAFDLEGPQISFMIALPPGTATSDYPEQAR